MTQASVARIWSARSRLENAGKYASHLRGAVFPELEKLEGFSGGQLLERHAGSEVEIVVITYWRSIENVRAFAGDDMERAVVTGEAAALLSDFDRRVRHYEIVFDSSASSPQ